jgi:hypothetical protein
MRHLVLDGWSCDHSHLETTPREKRARRYAPDMAAVMIHCPKTEKDVHTGLDVDADEFAAIEPGDHVLDDCEACGGSHVWELHAAFLESTMP